MFKYKQVKPQKIIHDAVTAMIDFCSKDLGIPSPACIFIKNIKEDEAASPIVEYGIDAAGLAHCWLGKNGTIFIHVDASLFKILGTVAHEVWHIYAHQNGLEQDEKKAEFYSIRAIAAAMLGYNSTKALAIFRLKAE